MTCEIPLRYEFAEECTNRALGLNPQFTKARFRRGQARKGGLQLAAAAIGALTRAIVLYLEGTRATETDG
jgi:hypothetical protein